jgi:hydroxymethylpyrimidine pyrophosphatase-like HAD family hydrolase
MEGMKHMKIIASDYDGTLNYGGIGPEKRAAILRWQDSGNLFGLISGRSLSDLLDLTKKFDIPCDFLLADSGSTIARSDGTVIHRVCCNGAVVRPLVAALITMGSRMCGVRSERVYTVRPSRETCSVGEYTIDTLPEVPWFTQINTQQNSAEEAAKVVAAIKKDFGDQVNPLQNEEWIDIVPAGMNKARGLYHLLNVLHAAPEDLITVGDNLNDWDMIAEFRSYAVANAVPEIQTLANAVIAGIAELIEKELHSGK